MKQTKKNVAKIKNDEFSYVVFDNLKRFFTI